MPTFVCKKCGLISPPADLEDASITCDHVWLQVDQLLETYRNGDQQPDARFQRFHELQSQGFNHIVTTIDGLFKSGKWVVSIILLIAGLFGFLGFKSLFDGKQLITDSQETLKQLEQEKEKLKKTEDQFKAYRLRIDNEQDMIGSLLEVESVLQSIRLQGLPEETLKRYNTGRSEFEVIRGEVEYIKQRVEKWRKAIDDTNRPACSDGDNENANHKGCIDKAIWYDMLIGYTEAIKTILQRDSKSGYLGSGGLGRLQALIDDPNLEPSVEYFPDVHLKVASIQLDFRQRNLDKAKKALDSASKAFAKNPLSGESERPNDEYYLLQGMLHLLQYWEDKKDDDLRKAQKSFEHQRLAHCQKDYGPPPVYPCAPANYYTAFTYQLLAEKSDSQQKLLRKAYKHAEKADDLLPITGYAEASNAMAFLLAEKFDDASIEILDKPRLASITYIQKAIASMPNDPVIMASFFATKSDVLEQAQFYGRAVRAQVKAVETFPRDHYIDGLFTDLLERAKRQFEDEPEANQCLFLPDNASSRQWWHLGLTANTLSRFELWTRYSKLVAQEPWQSLLGDSVVDGNGTPTNEKIARCLQVASLDALQHAVLGNMTNPFSSQAQLEYALASRILTAYQQFRTFDFDQEGLQDAKDTKDLKDLSRSELSQPVREYISNITSISESCLPCEQGFDATQWFEDKRWPLIYVCYLYDSLIRAQMNQYTSQDAHTEHLDLVRNNLAWARVLLLESVNPKQTVNNSCPLSDDLTAEMKATVGDRIIGDALVGPDAAAIYDTLAETYWQSAKYKLEEELKQQDQAQALIIAKLLSSERKKSVCKKYTDLAERVKNGSPEQIKALALVSRMDFREIAHLNCKVNRFSTRLKEPPSLDHCAKLWFSPVDGSNGELENLCQTQ